MTPKSPRQMIEEIHETTIRLSTVLLGVPGTANGGLVQEVKSIKVDIRELGHSHGKLKKSFWILVGVLAGSSVIGTGVWGILK